MDRYSRRIRPAHSLKAAQLLSQADKPPIRLLGGGAAVGGSELHGVTPAAPRSLRIYIVSRGGCRAAVGQEREAACSLE